MADVKEMILDNLGLVIETDVLTSAVVSHVLRVVLDNSCKE